MELGQIKLDYNNEVLKFKKHFIQAKTQCINNLSRKGKQLKSRQASDKCPDEIKEKNKRKLETIVAEIFIMKKLKFDELARFAMLNFEKLTKIMDSPVASKEKAMAKITAHKSLKSKFLLVKEKFSHVPTDKLLELDPRKQRKKKKKEQTKLKQSELEKSAPNTDIPKTPKKKSISNIESLDDDGDEALNKFYNSTNKSQVNPTDNFDDKESETHSENTDEDEASESCYDEKIENETEDIESDDVEVQSDISISDTKSTEEDDQPETDGDIKLNESKIKIPHLPRKYEKFSKNKPKGNQMLALSDGKINISTPNIYHPEIVVSKSETSVDDVSQKLEKAPKNKHKDKRMFVDIDDVNINISSQKIVDSFFMTDSGDNYLTVAIPRPPDAINDDGDQYNMSNRRLRRAAMFGKSLAPRNKKPFEHKQFNTPSQKSADYRGNRNFMDNSKQDGYSPKFHDKNDNSFQNNSNFRSNDRTTPLVNKVPEKLHPSWEAKKQKMSILPFQGNKIMFD